MEAKAEKVAFFYNNVKSIYNLSLEVFFGRGRKIAAKQINRNTIKLLDIGCNEGQLVPLLKENIEYLGIDIAAQCIYKAQKKFKHIPNTKFKVSNGEISDVKSGSKDTITLFYTLSVSPNADVLMQECHRILKPKGKLYIVNHFSNAKVYQLIDRALSSLRCAAVKFYFPNSIINQAKGFNIANKFKVNVFWTYLELEKV